MDPLRELSTEDWHSIFPGVEDINPIPMTGGYSGAGLYKVIIDNKIFDASTSGEYIDKNKNIEVVENEGSSIKVKQIT